MQGCLEDELHIFEHTFNNFLKEKSKAKTAYYQAEKNLSEIIKRNNKEIKKNNELTAKLKKQSETEYADKIQKLQQDNSALLKDNEERTSIAVESQMDRLEEIAMMMMAFIKNLDFPKSLRKTLSSLYQVAKKIVP